MTRPRTGLWLFPDAPSADVVAAVEHAEAAGLDEVWLGDEGPARDPFGLLAAAAVRTERVRLAVGVTNPYLRHPAATAATAATLHELSGGRMVLGLGPGGRLSLDPVGIAPARPLTDCRRALRVIRGVLAGEAVEGYEPPAHAIRAPDLPVVVGARGERFNRWASAEADGVFVAGVAPALVPTVVGWARSVRPVDVCVHVSVCLHEDDVELVRPRMIHAFADAPAELRRRAGLGDAEVHDAVEAFGAGDDAPARRLLTDPVLSLVLARPATVVDTCARLVHEVRPDGIGLAVLGAHPVQEVERAAAVLARVEEVVS